MIDIFQNNPIVSVGLCVTLFGCLAFHRLALYRQKLSERVQASEKFVSSVTSVLSEIYPVSSSWPENIDAYLRNKFPLLQSAVEAFKPYACDKKGFERAWKLYRLGDTGRNIDKQLYHQYMGFQTNDEPRIIPEQRMQENIGRLLSHAKNI